jgi:predicted HicB family RNase H-like nuclease
MPVSKAKMKANAKYNAKAYDRMHIVVKKGQKQAIEKIAKTQGNSINGYIKKAVETQIKTDTGDDIEL